MSQLTYANSLILEGRVSTSPQFSHENHHTSFHRLILDVPRLSGQIDHIPVLLPATMAQEIVPGQTWRLGGQLRSFNNKSGIGNRLVLSAFAQESLPTLDAPYNAITLQGTLCKPPQFRRTPLGRNICDLMLAVPRHYGRSDYLPIIAWGQLALATSCLTVGSPLRLEGRVQSRDYQKTIGSMVTSHTAYEVSMMQLEEL